jgi:hypothetical protein
MTGHYFNLGQRVTSTSAQDYREVRRFADITYSGIYNAESNVNKLNEFNLGLSNYKSLETSYGHIRLIDGRKTDVLVLQEDKISYVLVGKNLLSDAGAGSALVSVPEVLGTQIAREEEYGISYQPESFAKYGYDKYFTDVKRGSVLNLSGSSAQNEQLTVISNLGMRPYFRSQFTNSLYTQKLGGYDPYHDEYVLNLNDIPKPIEVDCKNCDTRFTVKSSVNRQDFCFNTGGSVGELTVTFSTPTASTFTATVTHSSNTDTQTFTNQTFGYITIQVDDPTVPEYTVSVSSVSDVTVTVNAGCPKSEAMQLRFITITSDSLSGQNITNEMYWTQGAYTSSSSSDSVQFLEGGYPFVISQYQVIEGLEGVGIMPTEGATARVISRKTSTDSFTFDPSYHRIYALRTSNEYPVTTDGIESLINNAELLNPINIDGAPSQYYGEYNVPSSGSIIYFLFDYRDIHAAEVCFDRKLADSACCDCEHSCSDTVAFFCTEPVSYAEDVCSLSSTNVLYHSGGGLYPEIGDRVYSYDVSGEVFEPVNFSLIGLESVNMKIKTSSSGLIISRIPCDSYQALFGIGSNNASDACSETETVTFYMPIDPSNIAVNQLLFTSPNMQTAVPPGFYRHNATANVVEVGPDGIIFNIDPC